MASLIIISTFLQFICHSKTDTGHCDSFNSKLCGDVVLYTDSNYEVARHQYGSVSFPQNVKPSMIVFAKCDDDIKTTLYYANQCGYKVVMRSGGHQYSGLSSCNLQKHPCIQLDLSAYKTIQEIENGEIKAGVGVHLKDLNIYLKNRGLFLPHGDCGTVAVGGHIQTGGQGHIHNQFGSIADHVTGFDIFLQNGELVQVSKPSNWQINIAKTKNETGGDHPFNDILYYSVLGGNPGCFGVISSVTFAPLHDAIYSQNSVFYSCEWPFNRETLNNMLVVMQQIYAEIDDFNLLNTDYTFYLRVIKGEPYGNVIKFYANFVSTSGANLNETYFDRFINAANDIENVECHPMYISPSQYLNGVLIPFIFDDAKYKTRLQPTPYLLSDEFIAKYIDKVQQLYNENRFNSISFYGDVVFQGGNSVFANPNVRTSMPITPNLQINTQLFWNENISDNAQFIVENWMHDTWALWFNTKTFGFGTIDYRAFGATFGNFNIDKVWKFYYGNQQLYDSLRSIKTEVDPNDLFSNTMTLKPFVNQTLKTDL